MNWQHRLQQRASRALPARLGRCALMADDAAKSLWPSPLLALPGARTAPGMVRFALAADICAAVCAQGLAFLRDARSPRGSLRSDQEGDRYGPWCEGGYAITLVEASGLPLVLPANVPVYASTSSDTARWLVLLPTQGELWFGWRC